MVKIPASKILDAVEDADIESIRDDGILAIVIDRELMMAMPALPPPRVSKSPDNVVIVHSGSVFVARIEAGSAEDAEDIAATLDDLLAMV